MRILVVDDEPAVRRSVRSALTLEGYEVRLAREGAEALDVLASERVDAIVLDLLMPGLDGLEVCRRLRADGDRSEEHTSELQSRGHLVCRLLLEKKKEILY